MSLPQLIGLQCVTCQKGISSVIDATFCDACGNPVHRTCASRLGQNAADRCPQCGGDPADPIAKEVQRERGAMAQEAALSVERMKYPISKDCPKCGGVEFTRQRPQGWVAFAWDRVCNACGTRYSPPTPGWASVVFIVAGLILAGFGGFSILAGMSSLNPLFVPRMLCEGFLGVLGVLALIQGIRGLVYPGKV